jgi:hypothetical protein
MVQAVPFQRSTSNLSPVPSLEMPTAQALVADVAVTEDKPSEVDPSQCSMSGVPPVEPVVEPTAHASDADVASTALIMLVFAMSALGLIAFEPMEFGLSAFRLAAAGSNDRGSGMPGTVPGVVAPGTAAFGLAAFGLAAVEPGTPGRAAVPHPRLGVSLASALAPVSVRAFRPNGWTTLWPHDAAGWVAAATAAGPTAARVPATTKGVAVARSSPLPGNRRCTRDTPFMGE